jgi:predicted AAA+ superfamily ATPase
MEAVQTQPTYPRGLDFEQVWAALMENREQQKETERILKENAEQLERQIKKSARQLNKQLGKLGGRYGEMVEYMVAPNLLKKFRKLGLVFEKSYQQGKIEDENNKTVAEVDITLENSNKIMYVEVKSKPTTEDITEHVKRMEKIRAHADTHNDQRKFLGAIAGMVFNDNEKEFAMKNGFYVIVPSGKTFTITVPEGDYSPREW